MSRVSSLLKSRRGRRRPKRNAPALPAQHKRYRSAEGPRSCAPPLSGLRRLLLVVLHFLEVGVDHVVVAAAGLLSSRLAAGAGLAAVDGLAELQRDLPECGQLGLDVIHILALGGRF